MLDHESEVCFRTHIKMLCRWHDWKNRMNTTAVVCCCCCLDHWLITKVPLLMATGCCTPMRHCDCYPYLFLVNTRGALNVVQPTIWVTINPGMCQSINWSFLTDETPEIGFLWPACSEKIPHLGEYTHIMWTSLDTCNWPQTNPISRWSTHLIHRID